MEIRTVVAQFLFVSRNICFEFSALVLRSALRSGLFWGQKNLGPFEIADYVFCYHKKWPPARLESAVNFASWKRTYYAASRLTNWSCDKNFREEYSRIINTASAKKWSVAVIIFLNCFGDWCVCNYLVVTYKWEKKKGPWESMWWG